MFKQGSVFAGVMGATVTSLVAAAILKGYANGIFYQLPFLCFIICF
jgi:hypothetical protein